MNKYEYRWARYVDSKVEVRGKIYGKNQSIAIKTRNRGRERERKQKRERKLKRYLYIDGFRSQQIYMKVSLSLFL